MAKASAFDTSVQSLLLEVHEDEPDGGRKGGNERIDRVWGCVVLVVRVAPFMNRSSRLDES